ncbi:hypothetical protein COCNU_01G015810 [Cocos nucifera]|uniref:Uncharacterized protein n=1 Tax=Cocos nucifera TaxID=13894 RepID=A0A8K0HVX3_COCNU|nr:hypothetical protein COCNU_01G015810 [Cocos nucifera]
MRSGLADEGDQERERERSRDGKARREGFNLAAIFGHDGTKMPSRFHPCLSVGYGQFSIRGAVGAYSVHLSIDCLGIFTIGIYSISGNYSTDNYVSTIAGI